MPMEVNGGSEKDITKEAHNNALYMNVGEYRHFRLHFLSQSVELKNEVKLRHMRQAGLIIIIITWFPDQNASAYDL